MLPETKIKIALNEVLEGLSLPYKIAGENTEIDWNLQVPFFRTWDQPLGKTQCTLGTNGFNRHVGIFHIEVCYPSNTGVIQPLNVAEMVMPSYKRGTDLLYETNKIRCVRTRIVPAYVENSWYILPIYVTYRADMRN